MGIFIYFVDKLNITLKYNLFISIISGVFVYIGMIYFTHRGYIKEMLSIFKRL